MNFVQYILLIKIKIIITVSSHLLLIGTLIFCRDCIEQKLLLSDLRFVFTERLQRTVLAAGNALPTLEQLRGKLIVRVHVTRYCTTNVNTLNIVRFTCAAQYMRKSPPPSESSPLPRGDGFDSIVTCSGAHFESLAEARLGCTSAPLSSSCTSFGS